MVKSQIRSLFYPVYPRGLVSLTLKNRPLVNLAIWVDPFSMIAMVCKLQRKFQISAMTSKSKIKVTYTLNLSTACSANSTSIFEWREFAK